MLLAKQLHFFRASLKKTAPLNLVFIKNTYLTNMLVKIVA